MVLGRSVKQSWKTSKSIHCCLGGGKVSTEKRAALSLAFDRAARPKVEAHLHYAYTKSRRQGASHATWPMTICPVSFF